jgi:hypothetical protein
MKVSWCAMAVLTLIAAATCLAQEDTDYTYDPGMRRDPFVPLFEKSGPDREAWTVEQVKVVGITQTPTGFVAILAGPESKTRFMKEGERLEDGVILRIFEDRVVFKQYLPETEHVREREIVKKLHPVGESRISHPASRISYTHVRCGSGFVPWSA